MGCCLDNRVEKFWVKVRKKFPAKWSSGNIKCNFDNLTEKFLPKIRRFFVRTLKINTKLCFFLKKFFDPHKMQFRLRCQAGCKKTGSFLLHDQKKCEKTTFFKKTHISSEYSSGHSISFLLHEFLIISELYLFYLWFKMFITENCFLKFAMQFLFSCLVCLTFWVSVFWLSFL